VRRLEHASFTTGIDDAFEALNKKKALNYSDVLSTHNTLFEAMYPWAGQDRAQTAPNIAVSRGSVLFAHPKYIQNAIEHAPKLGNDPKAMREKAGEVMGYLAHGHPSWTAMDAPSWSFTPSWLSVPALASIGPRRIKPPICKL